MKTMATRIPETIVLEDKLHRLDKVEPRLDVSLNKIE
jgi:hypothetical protein